jgi:hypothetical protein
MSICGKPAAALLLIARRRKSEEKKTKTWEQPFNAICLSHSSYGLFLTNHT